MKIEEIAIEDLVPYKNNQRVHTEDQLHKIADSIKEFGFLAPCIIDKDNVLITGHGRVDAASIAGYKKVPCVRAENLDEDQANAYRIADNRLQDLSYFDDSKVALELQQLLDNEFPIWKTGFDDFNNLDIAEFDEDIEVINDQRVLPKMERLMDEHHDYVVFMFDNKYDWIRVCEMFDVKRVNASVMPDKTKIGVGRVMDGKRLLGMLDAENNPE